MRRFHQDLSFGFKSLLRQPGFTLVAVLTLALGIGANAAVLSFAFPMLFPAFPYYNDPDGLVMLQRWSESTQTEISYPTYSDWQERSQVCRELSVFIENSRILTGPEGNPERIDGLLVSGNLLKTLGIEPHMGRGFVPEDDLRGAGRTVMLSYELWQRRFGGDPEMVERLITLDHLTYTVIGILPRGLSFEKLNGRPMGSIWLPINLFYDEWGLGDRTRVVDYTPICRLKPDVSLSAASEDMTRIARALAEEHGEDSQHPEIQTVPIGELEIKSVRPMVLALLAGVVFVLFIAFANLVNLFLSRFVGRQQEFAIRSALGADRSGLMALGLAEALVVALMASVLGLIAAYFVATTLPPFLRDVANADHARISPPVFGYTILLCLVATLVTGLIPTLRTISPSWRQLWASSLGSRSFPAHGGLRQSLIAAEIALAFLLLTGTGLALASFLNMRGEDRGFSTQKIVTFDLDLPLPEYLDIDKWTAFFDRTLSATAGLPGVEAVALLSDPPAGNRRVYAPVFAGGRPIPPRDKRPYAFYYTVSPELFRVLEIPLLEGRTFVRDDDGNSDWVLVISKRVAELFWPGESAVGRKLAFEGWGNIHDPSLRWREVIGVVDDVHFLPLNDPPHRAVFVPYTQRPRYRDGEALPMTLLLKTEIEPTSLTETVRSEILKLDPGQPLDKVKMLEDFIAGDLRPAQTILVLFSLIAALALALALVGVYGVMSYLTAARRNEIGIRMALGAGSPQILSDLLRQSLVSILVGIVLGWIATALFVRLATNALYAVEPFDLFVYSWATFALAVVAILATAVPAARATRIDPALLLHEE